MPSDDVYTPKTFYETVYRLEDTYATSSEDLLIYQRRVYEMSQYVNFDGMILEIGCGRGLMRTVGPHYIGIDISIEALKGNNFARSVSSAEILPFPDQIFDFVFSFHTLEHVGSPEHVLSEINRVLKPNGVAFLKPAWNCRSWNNKKLLKKPYSDLSFQDKVEKVLIPLRNSVIFRGLFTIPIRLLREISYLLNKQPTELSYRRLIPNYVYDQYWVSDADAVSSIDPHEVIWFFKSRGYEIFSHSSFAQRVLTRSEGVAAQRNLIHRCSNNSR